MKIGPLILGLFYTFGSIQGAQQPFGLDEKLGAKLPPALYVLNEDSVRVLLNELITKPTLLVFIYYSCTEQCPEMLEGVTELVNNAAVLPGADYRIITLSIDQKESAGLARCTKQKYIRKIQKPVDPFFWRFFTADSSTIQLLTSSVGWEFRHSGSSFIHPTVSVLITPRKMVSQYFYGTYFNYMHFDFSVSQAAQELTEPTRLKNMRYCTNNYSARTELLRVILLISGIFMVAGVASLYFYLTFSGKPIADKSHK